MTYKMVSKEDIERHGNLGEVICLVWLAEKLMAEREAYRSLAMREMDGHLEFVDAEAMRILEKESK